jgi:hypothetical protein
MHVWTGFKWLRIAPNSDEMQANVNTVTSLEQNSGDFWANCLELQPLWTTVTDSTKDEANVDKLSDCQFFLKGAVQEVRHNYECTGIGKSQVSYSKHCPPNRHWRCPDSLGVAASYVIVQLMQWIFPLLKKLHCIPELVIRLQLTIVLKKLCSSWRRTKIERTVYAVIYDRNGRLT